MISRRGLIHLGNPEILIKVVDSKGLIRSKIRIRVMVSRGLIHLERLITVTVSHQSLTRFGSLRTVPGSHQVFIHNSFRDAGDSDQGHGFSRFDALNANDSGFVQSSGSFLARFDSIRGSGETDKGNSRFLSFDDSDPFGSTGPFKTSVERSSKTKFR